MQEEKWITICWHWKVTDCVSAQGVLADYNMLVDKLNTDTERAEVEMECVEVKAANEQTSQVSIIANEDLNGWAPEPMSIPHRWTEKV